MSEIRIHWIVGVRRRSVLSEYFWFCVVLALCVRFVRAIIILYEETLRASRNSEKSNDSSRYLNPNIGCLHPTLVSVDESVYC